VLAFGDELERAIGSPARAVGQARSDLTPVLLAKVEWGDEVDELGADRLLRRVPERPLRGDVELEDPSPLVDGDHGVERPIEYRRLESLRFLAHREVVLKETPPHALRDRRRAVRHTELLVDRLKVRLDGRRAQVNSLRDLGG